MQAVMQGSIPISSSTGRLNGRTSSPPSVLPLTPPLFSSGLFTGTSCLIKDPSSGRASPVPTLSIAVKPMAACEAFAGCWRHRAQELANGGRAAASGKGMASLPYPPGSQGRAGLGKHDGLWWCQASLRATLVGGTGSEHREGAPKARPGHECLHRCWRKKTGESRTMRTSVGEEMRRFPLLCSPQGLLTPAREPWSPG